MEDENYIKMLIVEIIMESRHDGWSLDWYKKKLESLTNPQSNQPPKNNNHANENQKPN